MAEHIGVTYTPSKVSKQILGSTFADLQVAISEYPMAVLYADASLPQNR